MLLSGQNVTPGLRRLCKQQFRPHTSVSEPCLHLRVSRTLLITFSGTFSVIGVVMNPGSTQLHRIPNLEEDRKEKQMTA